MTLYSNAERNFHHGSKIGFDFVRTVSSSHGEKQKSFKSHQLVPQAMSLSGKSSQTLSVPSGS